MKKENNKKIFKKYLNILITTNSCNKFNYSDFEDIVEINKDDYKNLISNHKVSEKEIDKCIKTLCTYLVNHNAKCLKIDLDVIDKKLEPVKEMTINDIEKELGYKIKIIK